MLKFGVIGVGAAGNQIVKLCAEEEMENIVAINASKMDLECVKEYVEDCILIDGEGCGKDRKIAKTNFKKEIKEILPVLNEKFKDCAVVVIVGSTGGGTGSGMVPILANVLKDVAKKNVIAMSIIPKHTETMKAQYNSIECLKEIDQLNIPYVVYDNDNVKGNTIQTFDRINNCIVEDIKILMGELNVPSSYGIMDEMDTKKVIFTPGMMKVGKLSGIKENYLDQDGLSQLILKSINQSLCADSERDRVVKRAGYILNLDKQILSIFNKESNSLNKEVGVPMEAFEQLNVIEESEPGKIAVILSGLSFPNTRVEEMVEIIETHEEMMNKAQTSKVGELHDRVNWFDEDEAGDNEESADLDSILNQYI